jgi:hypothetical protein
VTGDVAAKAGRTLDEWVALPNVLRTSRSYPGDDDWLVFKEGLPFRGVWALHRRTDMSGTELFFQVRPLEKLDALSQPWGLGILMLWMFAWERRKWLKANATRTSPSVWRRAKRPH